LQKEWKPGATAILEEFEGIGCLFTGERIKRTIVQLYNHNSTTLLYKNTVAPTLVVLQTSNEFEIVPP